MMNQPSQPSTANHSQDDYQPHSYYNQPKQLPNDESPIGQDGLINNEPINKSATNLNDVHSITTRQENKINNTDIPNRSFLPENNDMFAIGKSTPMSDHSISNIRLNSIPSPHESAEQTNIKNQSTSISTIGSNAEIPPQERNPTLASQLPLSVVTNKIVTPPPSNTSAKHHDMSSDENIKLLVSSEPCNIDEYAIHLRKLTMILLEAGFDPKHLSKLHNKLNALFNSLDEYFDPERPLHNKLYLIIEKNFDTLIKLSTSYRFDEMSTLAIRYLTTVFMNLNYWEIYNLLNWKPPIFHFLTIINFDLDDCYRNFLKDYSNYSYDKVSQPLVRKRSTIPRRNRFFKLNSSDLEYYIDDLDLTPEEREARSTQFFSLNPDTSDHDKYVARMVLGNRVAKRKFRPDVKLEHHKIIKKPQPIQEKSSTKSSNYDPDVVHECQLPSAEEPHKLCLRRFSRKYELIRHQETVHSKKKKLFKCYVCVKENPGVGPRIFTRHDTLAKHIRVNHKISGKEAKAEVAYSKKHAEVVEEGDITVHVGRRKTKVDFELRAHMEKRKYSGDETNYLETSDLESGDEEVMYNNTQLDQI